jgi:hypothetical protein
MSAGWLTSKFDNIALKYLGHKRSIVCKGEIILGYSLPPVCRCSWW